MIELHPKGKGENFIPWMKAIMRLGPKAAGAVTPLLEDLQKGKGMRRVFAAMALGEIGEKAWVAIPTLEILMDDSQPATRLRAAEALWRLDGRTNMVLPLMMAELKTWASNTNALRGKTSDVSGESREHVAARVLGEMGPVAFEATPQLRLMTKSSYDEIRTVAWVSLKKIQPAGKRE